VLLWLDGDVRLRSAAAEAMNFVEGALWSETGAGTNAIGTALVADHALQVHAAEHFSEVVHGWTCSAAPVHDPEDGRLLGIIDLTALMAKAHPHSLGAVLAAARAVEADLRVRAQIRDAQLRLRYLERTASTRDSAILVGRSGRVIADHPDGLLRTQRLEVPTDGGAVTLPNGRAGFAEVLERENAYLVRPVSGLHRGSRFGPERTERTIAKLDVADPGGDASEWRRAQLQLSRLAEEQAALRRVATLVAGQTTPEEIFATVAEEVARVLRADRSIVCRYELDETMTVTAFWTSGKRMFPVGTRIALDGATIAVLVRQSGRASRVEADEGIPGLVVDPSNAARSSVGAPILAEGRVWGVILVSSTGSLTDDTESRLTGFAELVATAVSNAVARAELNASRARIIAAADESRRRIERDLHDGAQQRLIGLALLLQTAATEPHADVDELRLVLDRAANLVTVALEELREVSHGIHPAILSQGGLAPALRGLSRRSAIPVELEMTAIGRCPEHVEVAAYYIVSELLANTVKHAHASVAVVSVEGTNGGLHLSIRDDGVGGADPTQGSGLIGLRDRVEALGGTFVIDSPLGAGTAVLVALPIG
jgi:signal transduction histidine kinase